MRQFLLLLSTILFTGCNLFKEELPTIRLGINPWPGYEFLYLANELKEFENQKFKVRLIEFNSLADSRRALETGQVDIIGSTVVDQVYVNQKTQLDAVVFYIVDVSTGGDILLTQPSIQSISQLKGKKIGIEPASLGIYETHLALKKGGLTLADIEPVAVYQNAVVETFLQRKIDGVLTFPPNSLSILKKDPRANIAWSSKDAPEKIIDVLLTTKKFAEANKKHLRTITEIFEKMRLKTVSGDQGAISIMADHEHISSVEFTSILETEVKVLTPQDQIRFFHRPAKILEIYSEVEKSLIEFKEFEKAKPATVFVDIGL